MGGQAHHGVIMSATPIADLHAAFQVPVARDDWRWQRVKQRTIRRCQEAAVQAFADLNDWKRVDSTQGFEICDKFGEKYAGYSYGPENILDHRVNFRRGRQAMASLGQPYKWPWWDMPPPQMWGKFGGKDEVELMLHMPPGLLASPYYPLHTCVVVVTRPGTEVRWLPEQLEAERWMVTR